jgi:DNA (cytosine-5)-methyltransferase 1
MARAKKQDRKPTLLDLFCGAGGATAGYQSAGYYVIGVDHNPQPNYCGDIFVRMDAISFLRDSIRNGEYKRWECIHSSPPCQLFSTVSVVHRHPLLHKHTDLISPLRKLLHSPQLVGVPSVIENVPGAPLRQDLLLCGSMFPTLRSPPNLGLIRHRVFEIAYATVPQPPLPCIHNYTPVSVHGNTGGRSRRDRKKMYTLATWKEVMGDVNWMTAKELGQSIPPAYTHYIGTYLYPQSLCR